MTGSFTPQVVRHICGHDETHLWDNSDPETVTQAEVAPYFCCSMCIAAEKGDFSSFGSARFNVHVIRDGKDVLTVPTELCVSQEGIDDISFCDGFDQEPTGGTHAKTGSDDWYQLKKIYADGYGKFVGWNMDLESGNYNLYVPFFSLEDERKAEAMSGSL